MRADAAQGCCTEAPASLRVRRAAPATASPDPKTKVMHLAGYGSHLYSRLGVRYLAPIGVVLKTAEYITGRVSSGRAMSLSSGPSGRGAAHYPAPRPSIMVRSLYLAFGLLAVRFLMRPKGSSDLLP